MSHFITDCLNQKLLTKTPLCNDGGGVQAPVHV